MPEDLQEQTSEANAGSQPEHQGADIADEEDLDVVLERVAPRRSGGCGWIGWVIGLVVIAAVAFAGWQHWERQEQEKERAARDQRMDQYTATKAEIRGKMDRAAKDASAGSIDAAVDVLQAAEVQWGQLAQLAQGQSDSEIANEATERKAALANVVKTLQADQSEAANLQAQIKGLQSKQDELNARVRDQILKLAGQADQPAKEPLAKGAKPAKQPAPAPAAK